MNIQTYVLEDVYNINDNVHENCKKQILVEKAILYFTRNHSVEDNFSINLHWFIEKLKPDYLSDDFYIYKLTMYGYLDKTTLENDDVLLLGGFYHGKIMKVSKVNALQLVNKDTGEIEFYVKKNFIDNIFFCTT